ncbi:MAG: hypothetical protein IJZ88_00335 [Clostridia bacterium]|nr:hypothetical protein [Clostridia bacterium]
MLSDKQKKKYVRAVSKCLKCSKKDKTECMELFTHSVEDIINQEEDITIEKLEGILGKPQEVAKELESAINPIAMKKYARNRKILLTTITIVIIVAMIGIWQYAVYYAVSPVYYVESPVLSPEEMEIYDELLLH